MYIYIVIEGGLQRASLKGHKFPILKIQYSPTSHFAFTCSSDVIYVWDTKTWERFEKLFPGTIYKTLSLVCANIFLNKNITLILHTGPGINTCSYSHDGKKIIVVFRDNIVRLYDTEVWTEVGRINMSEAVLNIKKPAGISSLALSKDGNYVVFSTASSILYLWDIQTSTAIRTVTLKPEWGSCHSNIC